MSDTVTPPCATDPAESVESIPLACRHCGLSLMEIPISVRATRLHVTGKCAEDDPAVSVTYSTRMSAAAMAARLEYLSRDAVESVGVKRSRLAALVTDLEGLVTLLKYEAVKS